MVALLKLILRDMSLGILYSMLLIALIISFPLLMLCHHFTKDKRAKQI